MASIYAKSDYIALATAAAAVYRALAAESTAAGLIPDETLNRVAHAIASIAEIYCQADGADVLRAVDPADLIGARFAQGAALLVKAGGSECQGLSVRRSEIPGVVAVLKGAGLFRPPPARDTRADQERPQDQESR